MKDKVEAYGEVMTRLMCHTADWTRYKKNKNRTTTTTQY